MLSSTKIKNLFSSLGWAKRKNMCPAPVQEVVRDGSGVSPGIVIGRVYVYDSALKNVPYYHISHDDIEDEKDRFLTAVQETTDQIDLIMGKVKDVLENDPLSALLDAYRHMLKGSRLTRGVCHRIKTDLLNAEAAVLDEVEAISEVFAAMEDPYLSSRIEDIQNIGMRLLRNLQTNGQDILSTMPENAVVIAKDLSAADTAMLNLRKITGLVSVNGSSQSHTALFARSLGLPAIVNVPDLLQIANTGDIIIIDGTYGKVILNPVQENVDLYRKYRTDFLRWKRSLKRLRDQPSITADDVYIQLKGNIDLPDEIGFLKQTGVDGIGLLRSEYIYLNRCDLPSEEELLTVLDKIAIQMQDKPITFRTIDIGADKCSSLFGQYKSANPALGLRGIRFAAKYDAVLRTQIRAVLRACAKADFRIMLPMVSSVDEVIKARSLVQECATQLRSEGYEIPNKLPALGVMIETPSAAMESDFIAQHCDFFSIGTNDLIQYTLAVDRMDNAVAPLFNPLNPAVLRLIKMTVESANAHQIPVSVCGEMAANYHYAALLIGLGVRELSMPAVNIPMVKERIRSLNMNDMTRFANHVLNIHLPSDVLACLNAFEEGTRY